MKTGDKIVGTFLRQNSEIPGVAFERRGSLPSNPDDTAAAIGNVQGGPCRQDARALLRRFGSSAGFAIVGAIELVIIGTCAIAALAAAAGDVDILGYATAVGSIIVGGLGHHLAAYGNARGGVVAVLAPIARLYATLDRAFPATGPARPALTPARRAPR